MSLSSRHSTVAAAAAAAVGLKPGAHKMLIELADPTHKIIASETINATVPETRPSGSHDHRGR